MTGQGAWRVAVIVAYPLVLSLFVWRHYPQAGLPLAAVTVAILRWPPQGRLALTRGLLIGLGGLATAVWVRVQPPSAEVVRAVLAMPPLVIAWVLSYAFGRTLRSPGGALITRVCRAERGQMSPALLRYTRRVTWLWTVVLAVFGLEALGLSVFASWPLWLTALNGIDYAAVALLMGGELFYRCRRYPYPDGRCLRHLWPSLRLAMALAMDKAP